ncbi:MAG TPA: hypothetical protein VFD02_02835 [Syntrophomonadaceae bacterium]|nr:hypothetical protein [Syntrophomonadaceae bacterium]
MRGTNFIFIILIIAAAVITGSTIAIASNFDFITAQVKQNQVANTSVDNIVGNLSGLENIIENKDLDINNIPKATPDPDLTDDILSQLEDIKKAHQTEAKTTPKTTPENKAPNEPLSQHEQGQILEMLCALGMINCSDHNNYILNFQKEHLLEPTGELDSWTLDIIIEQIRLERNPHP